MKNKQKKRFYVGVIIAFCAIMCSFVTCKKTKLVPPSPQKIANVVYNSLQEELKEAQADMGMGMPIFVMVEQKDPSFILYKGVVPVYSSYEWESEITAKYNGKTVSYYQGDESREKVAVTTANWPYKLNKKPVETASGPQDFTSLLNVSDEQYSRQKDLSGKYNGSFWYEDDDFEPIPELQFFHIKRPNEDYNFEPVPGLDFNNLRVLELNEKRMNGPDVEALQKRLLYFGFAGVGEADGYYGPKTTETIKTIQKFAGFEEDGKVDRALWYFIFGNDDFNIKYLSLIQIVAKYKPNELRKIEGRLSYEYQNFYGYSYTIYFANDGRMRILDISGGNGDNGYGKTYYFADSDKYIVLYYIQNVNERQARRNVFISTDDYSANIKQGKRNSESSYRHDDSEMLGILYTLRFR